MWSNSQVIFTCHWRHCSTSVLCVFVRVIYLLEFSLSIQELCDSSDELWIHEQRFTIPGHRRETEGQCFGLMTTYEDRRCPTLTVRWGRPTFLWSTSTRGFAPEGSGPHGWWRQSHPAQGPGQRSETGSVTWETQRYDIAQNISVTMVTCRRSQNLRLVCAIKSKLMVLKTY